MQQLNEYITQFDRIRQCYKDKSLTAIMHMLERLNIEQFRDRFGYGLFDSMCLVATVLESDYLNTDFAEKTLKKTQIRLLTQLVDQLEEAFTDDAGVTE